jgi:hypothetical protein
MVDVGCGGVGGQNGGVLIAGGQRTSLSSSRDRPHCDCSAVSEAVGDCLWGGEDEVVFRVVGDDPPDCRQRHWGTIFSTRVAKHAAPILRDCC